MTTNITPPPPNKLLDFTGQAVLVTGSSRGIGQGIARRFAEAGADVAVHYQTNKADAQTLVAEIESLGGRAIAIEADVTLSHEATRIVKETVDGFGRLDVLINNVGSYPLIPLLDISPYQWDVLLDVNLRSTFLCTQNAAQQMIAQGGGAIVNIASIEAEQPGPMHSYYSTAKAGVLAYTKSAASELGTHGIRVNAVSPGLIWREGLSEDWPEGVERWQQAAPLTRLGQPEDVADACLFLASPAARWISGINLRVDGGVTTQPSF